MSETSMTSMDFYTVRSRGFVTLMITITLVVVVLLLIYLAIYALSKVPKSCTAPPASPTEVEAGYVNATTFRVLWRRVADVTKYTVYVGQTPSFARPQSINITTTNQTYADIKGLEMGRTYYIMVSSSNNCGESPNSDKITFIFVQV